MLKNFKAWIQFVNRAEWKRHFELPKRKKITKGAFGRSRYGMPLL